MSIFGTQPPKFIEGTTTVLLDYSTVVRDEPELQTIRLQSPISGHKVFVNRGSYWFFDVAINLYKYGDPVAAYANFKAYLNAEVTLYRHRDGPPFTKPEGGNCPFRLVEVTAYAIENLTYRDGLLLRFESIDRATI